MPESTVSSQSGTMNLATGFSGSITLIILVLKARQKEEKHYIGLEVV
jgi:hypothetical protein